MKVLVTGGGGFVGRNLIDKLIERGVDVQSFGRSKQTDLEARGVNVIHGDISNPIAVNNAIFNVDAVFHVAAKAGIWGNWKEYFNTNVMGTRNVIKACKKHGIKRLVYTSTPSVVFNGDKLENADEKSSYMKNCLCYYAKTKAVAEEEVLKANEMNGLRTIALRPHLIWGIGDHHLLPRIIEKAKVGKLKIIGEGKNLVDVTHIKNVVHAHILALDALENGVGAGQAYFITNDEPVNLWDWLNAVFKELEINPVEKKLSLNTAYRFGALCEAVYKILKIKKDPPMSRFLAVELGKHHYFNIAKAKKDLGYKPIVSLADGLAELASYMKIKQKIK